MMNSGAFDEKGSVGWVAKAMQGIVAKFSYGVLGRSVPECNNEIDSVTHRLKDYRARQSIKINIGTCMPMVIDSKLMLQWRDRWRTWQGIWWVKGNDW